MKGKAHFQQPLASQSGFEKYARKSRREEFLGLMESVVPWRDLEAVIEPHYPKTGNGRQPVGLSITLRVYFLQQWFNLSDPGAEDALYESPALRRFAGVDLGRAPVYTVDGFAGRLLDKIQQSFLPCLKKGVEVV